MYMHQVKAYKKVFPYFCYVPFTLNLKTLFSSLLFVKAKPSGIVHEDKTKHVQQSLEHEHAIEQPIEMKGGVESIEFKEGELLVQTQQQVVARCSKSQFNKSNAPTQTLHEGEQSTQQEQLDKIFDQFT